MEYDVEGSYYFKVKLDSITRAGLITYTARAKSIGNAKKTVTETIRINKRVTKTCETTEKSNIDKSLLFKVPEIKLEEV